MYRFLQTSSALLALALLFVGCQEGGLANLDVENKNNPTQSSVLQDASDIKGLLKGSTTSMMQATVSDWGPHMDLMADQTTSTNAFRSFWARASEPRDPINNSTTFATPEIFADPWSNYNQAQGAANQILRLIEVDGRSIVLDDGSDITTKMRASAYFLRGVARGYVGMVYDRGFAVPVDQDPLGISAETAEPQPYGEVIDAAVADLEKAISIIEGSSGFQWDLLQGNSYSSSALKQFAHSFAARFLMAKARTRQEARNFSDSYLDRVIDHANNGVGGNGPQPAFSPASVSGDFLNENAGWSTFVIPGPAGYLPVDVKVSKLLDPSYVTQYPTDTDVVLDPISTSDPRGLYFFYTDAFGFLRASRNRALFSNYFHLRQDGANNWFGRDGDAVVLATGAEMQYLKAEAYLLKGQKPDAEAALENSPFGNKPVELTTDLPATQGRTFFFPDNGYPFGNGTAAGRDISASASNAKFIRALHTEYSVELFLMGGVGCQWFFMRRHGLLQEGTAEHYPLPGVELEVLQQVDNYTFGGVSNAGNSGTAPGGSNSWKNFDETYNITSPVGYSSSSTKSSRFELPDLEGSVGEGSLPMRAGQQ